MDYFRGKSKLKVKIGPMKNEKKNPNFSIQVSQTFHEKNDF